MTWSPELVTVKATVPLGAVAAETAQSVALLSTVSFVVDEAADAVVRSARSREGEQGCGARGDQEAEAGGALVHRVPSVASCCCWVGCRDCGGASSAVLRLACPRSARMKIVMTGTT